MTDTAGVTPEWSVGEIAELTSAIFQGDATVACRGCAIDTRAIAPGSLFVALQGTNTHGIEHAEAAKAAGAAAIAVGNDSDTDAIARAAELLPVITLDHDSFGTIGALGRAWRRRCGWTVVGVTGSAGKTSTKDLLRLLLTVSKRVVASHANHNNEIGVPLTLLLSPADTDVVICEMGMRGLGQIKYLCDIAEPDIGIVTNAGTAHLGLLGSRERIVEAKAELLAGVKPDGVGIFPAAQPELRSAARQTPTIVRTFGWSSENADCTVTDVDRLPSGIAGMITFEGSSHSFELPVHGQHQALNLAAAACAAWAIDPALPLLHNDVNEPVLTSGRGDRYDLPGNVVLIDDAYNANPESMQASLVELEALLAERKVAILGYMAELGDAHEPELHRELGRQAAESGVDLLIVVEAGRAAARDIATGYSDAGGTASATFDDVDTAAIVLPSLVEPGDAILVKASNSVGLGRLAALLVESIRDTAPVARSEEAPAPVTRMLLAGALSALIAMGLGPLLISWLRRREFGQEIREDGPQSHRETKQGTPTMGGLLIFAAMSVPYFLIGLDHTVFGFVVWTTMILCAMIGFWDDWAKVANRRSLGLSGKSKMLALVVVTAFLGWASHTLLKANTILEIPFTSTSIDIGWGYYILVFAVLAGASNAVNLTDGLDGLAAGTVVLSLLSFMGISFIIWERKLYLDSAVLAPFGRLGSLDVAIFCAALAGACVGYLWWNAWPAKIFMGDTGSMGLGGALAALAIVTKTELLLLIIGGIFVVEALSVIIQVAVFKKTGKRVFLMAPIHHHFELKNWSETQIMVRFYIVAGLFASTGFTIWWRTH